jgi:hypothetical protein
MEIGEQQFNAGSACPNYLIGLRSISRFDCVKPSPVQEVVLSRISRWFIHNYIGPAVGTRANAPSKARPAEVVEAFILDGFLRTNRMARELIRRASAYDVNTIRFRNPFVPFLRFTVGTGLEIIAKHEDRHLLQAQGVKQSAEFPRL